MKICVAQTRPVTGDIAENTDRHLRLIEQAASINADIIIFPELSLTGYEPTLAWKLAISPEDSRLEVFQQMSEQKRIIIGVGVPTRSDFRVSISMILFSPGQSRQVYSKRYLHPDEEPFFISGHNSPQLKVENANVALAICYELSVPQHAEDAHQRGAQVYIASVAKFVSGIDKAQRRLATIASTYSMTVLMANCIGLCDGEVCAGNSSAWNHQGELIGRLNDTEEGLLMVDTDTQAVIEVDP